MKYTFQIVPNSLDVGNRKIQRIVYIPLVNEVMNSLAVVQASHEVQNTLEQLEISKTLYNLVLGI